MNEMNERNERNEFMLLAYYSPLLYKKKLFRREFELKQLR